jgi:Carboxypeptidase regulatory-like domain
VEDALIRALLLSALILLVVQQSTTGRVEITVRDANTREGVAGVPITLTFRVPNEPPGSPNTLVTDPRGLITFPALRTGAYTVSIAEGFQAVSSSEYFLVDAGAQNRVEITVKRITTVAGRIVDQNGAPSVAAVISLLSTVYADGRQVQRTAARTTIDREGRFRITGVPLGEYYMRIENEAPWSVAYYPGVADPLSAQKLAIRDQTPFFVEVTLPDHPRFKVSGTVIHAPSESGGALTVYIAHDNTNLQEAPFLASASSLRVSSTEVRFELKDIPAGSYVLYPVLGTRSIGTLGRENLRVEDHDVQDLRIALKPLVGIRGRVMVKDSQARLPENLRIATPSRESLPPLLVSDLSRTAIAVSRSGEFAVRNLVEGERYAISLEGLPGDAYVSDVRLGNRSIVSDSSFVATLTEESFEVEISMPGGVVRGTVRDAAGQPLAKASVVAVPDFARRRNPAFYKRATTDSRGQFVIQGLAPGEYQLFTWPAPPPQGTEEDPAFLGRFESQSTRVRASSGITTETDLKLIQ